MITNSTHFAISFMSEKVGTTANGIPSPPTTKAGIDSHNFLLRTQDNYMLHYTQRQFKYKGQNEQGYILTDSSMHALHISPAVFITTYVHSTGGNMYARYFLDP